MGTKELTAKEHENIRIMRWWSDVGWHRSRHSPNRDVCDEPVSSGSSIAPARARMEGGARKQHKRAHHNGAAPKTKGPVQGSSSSLGSTTAEGGYTGVAVNL